MRRAAASALALAAAATTLVAGAAPAAQAEPKLIECQQPARTGEEVYALHGVTKGTACPVVRALAKWEYHPTSHITELYTCVGAGHQTPKLVRHRFDGWTLSIDNGFVMSKGGASFKVTGTDFPLNCS